MSLSNVLNKMRNITYVPLFFNLNHRKKAGPGAGHINYWEGICHLPGFGIFSVYEVNHSQILLTLMQSFVKGRCYLTFWRKHYIQIIWRCHNSARGLRKAWCVWHLKSNVILMLLWCQFIRINMRMLVTTRIQLFLIMNRQSILIWYSIPISCLNRRRLLTKYECTALSIGLLPGGTKIPASTRLN